MFFSLPVGYMSTSFDFYCPTVGEHCLLFTPAEPKKTEEKNKYKKAIMLRYPLVRHNPLNLDVLVRHNLTKIFLELCNEAAAVN